MLGAVIGDMIGSPYEFINMYSRRKVKPFEHTLRGRCQFTDDTVLSMAVAMRIVPVGWLYSSLEDTLRIAKIATERTHNSKEAIEGAQMIAALNTETISRRKSNFCPSIWKTRTRLILTTGVR